MNGGGRAHASPPFPPSEQASRASHGRGAGRPSGDGSPGRRHALGLKLLAGFALPGEPSAVERVEPAFVLGQLVRVDCLAGVCGLRGAGR